MKRVDKMRRRATRWWKRERERLGEERKETAGGFNYQLNGLVFCWYGRAVVNHGHTEHQRHRFCPLGPFFYLTLFHFFTLRNTILSRFLTMKKLARYYISVCVCVNVTTKRQHQSIMTQHQANTPPALLLLEARGNNDILRVRFPSLFHF